MDIPYNLSGFKGLVLSAQSDRPMRYKLIIRDREGWDTVAWCKSFDLPAGGGTSFFKRSNSVWLSLASCPTFTIIPVGFSHPANRMWATGCTPIRVAHKSSHL